MTEVLQFLDAFHFMRPAWLFAVPAIAWLWWRARRRESGKSMPDAKIAPHLRDALTVGARNARRLRPSDAVAVVLVLTAVATAGPTWSRVADPFVAATAPVVIVLEVSTSMSETDVAPSRLERGKQKIRDLLALRAGARTALVAFAGTAHRVLPMTDDPAVMAPYLQDLTPEVMPEDGANATAALEIATTMLASEAASGGVLFVVDGLLPVDLDALDAAGLPALAVLAVVPEDFVDAGLAALGDGRVTRVTPDGKDIRRLDRIFDAAYRRSLLDNESQPWNDRGWLLAVPAAFLALFWFRRGWTTRLGAGLLAVLLSGPIEIARAEGVADWFLTADQQGQLAYDRHDFDRAAELYVEPFRQAYAMYRDGQYSRAAELFGRLDTAAAAFAEGMARVRNREYRDSVRAFEKTLERDPDFPGAAENLETARMIVSYIEEAREESDTGEDGGIGADEIVVDNDSDRGVETRIQADPDNGELLSADQWMNGVDTRTGDFLRQRFAIEVSRASRQ